MTPLAFPAVSGSSNSRADALTFSRGLLDASPVFAGYLAVGFAFGIAASRFGHPFWSPVLMSLTHVSGTGQFAVVDLLRAGAGAGEILAAVVVFNLRYVLMALAVAQRLSPAVGSWTRLAMACGDTDEIVGIAARQRLLPPRYWFGLFASSYAGWVAGTVLGALPAVRSLLSPDLLRALGLALYAMFLAILVPAAKKSRGILFCTLLAAALSTLLKLLPIRISAGWGMLVAGLAGALASAALFPVPAQAAPEEAP